MKYDFLKNSTNKTLKIGGLIGGINTEISPLNIKENQLLEGENVWLENGLLKTRAGLSCDANKAIRTEILGYSGENSYKIHNTGIYLNGEYKRIATSEVCTDDYCYTCNVYLIGEEGEYSSIGSLNFLRTTSEIFYVPINFLFYVGEAQTGGGIFTMVTVQNDYDPDEKYYYFYEISEDFTEWNRVYSFYIPTLYINGRGNKYEFARSENKLSVAAPKILESPNMLNGRFHAYFTSDGYSNSFRLPFADLSSEEIVCRIHYTLIDFVEWHIAADTIVDTKSFFGKQVTMEADRDKGTVFFSSPEGDFPIPLMDMYSENNIRITATKDIEMGIEKVIHSTCVLPYKSRIIVSGGQNGNELFVTSFDNPLYFPQNSSLAIGNGDSEVIALAVQDGKIVALKPDSVYVVTFNSGDRINQISLLSDNDKSFYSDDEFSYNEITRTIGCNNNECVTVLDNTTIFLGCDGQIYALNSLGGDGIKCISKCLGGDFDDFKYADFAFSGDGKYLIFKNNNAYIAQKKSKDYIWHYWKFPQNFKISGGFISGKTLALLCAGENSTLSYIAFLNSVEDNYLCYDDEGKIIVNKALIESKITTKYFKCHKKCDSVYMSIASRGNVSISINSKRIADINLRLNQSEYSHNCYKSVKLMPYISAGNYVFVTLSSKHGLNLGDMEINYI